MKFRKALHLCLLGAALTPLALACSSDSNSESDEGEITPDPTKNLFDQAGVCDLILKRHEIIRPIDMQDGFIRWNCGDVPGVTKGDFGQEYCEYNAVSGGKIVSQFSEIDASKGAACVFTAVYSDAWDQMRDPNSKLGMAMADASNLGSEAETDSVQMLGRFNSRGAATALITDCAKAAPNQPIDDARQVACWQAANAASEADKAQLAKLCRGNDLNNPDSSNWKQAEALGAKVLSEGEPGYETQRDLIGCLGTRLGGGVTWRNSDTIICGRVLRAAGECSCEYNPIPSAVLGFQFTGWTNQQLPPGCSYAQVDGGDFKNLVICKLSQADLDDIELNPKYNGDLQQKCRDQFATELVLVAPLRVLEKSGTCEKNGKAFCDQYVGGSGGAGGSGGMGGMSGSGGSAGSSGQGDCCTATPGVKGCTNAAVQTCQCTADSFCCDNEWDSTCVSEAQANCGLSCP